MVMNYQQNGCVPMSDPWSVITELHKAKFCIEQSIVILHFIPLMVTAKMLNIDELYVSVKKTTYKKVSDYYFSLLLLLYCIVKILLFRILVILDN